MNALACLFMPYAALVCRLEAFYGSVCSALSDRPEERGSGRTISFEERGSGRVRPIFAGA